MILSLSTAMAQTPTPSPNCQSIVRECKEVIDKADKALAEKDKQIDLYHTSLDHANSVIALQMAHINDSDAELSAWYRQPLVVGGIGISVGVLLLELLKK